MSNPIGTGADISIREPQVDSRESQQSPPRQINWASNHENMATPQGKNLQNCSPGEDWGQPPSEDDTDTSHSYSTTPNTKLQQQIQQPAQQDWHHLHMCTPISQLQQISMSGHNWMHPNGKSSPHATFKRPLMKQSWIELSKKACNIYLKVPYCSMLILAFGIYPVYCTFIECSWTLHPSTTIFVHGGTTFRTGVHSKLSNIQTVRLRMIQS